VVESLNGSGMQRIASYLATTRKEALIGGDTSR
jgi:hypothetical protein